MPRRSAFRGTYSPNKRPYVVLTPDAYVSIQGQTSVVACGECNRKVDLNRYVTGITSDANVESPPGSATITLSIPDNDVNQFYVEGQFIVISMMEIEIFSKGYYTVGGTPQYYRTFWGLINNVQQSWSGGVTTVTLSCRDILRWWELTNSIVNPAFLDIGKSSSGYQLYQNQFSGMNPYTVILALAKEAMGDFSITTGSFTSFRPEDGPERGVIAQFAKDIMGYWQLKFGNIWNNLVLFGSSGQSYTFAGEAGNVSPLKIAKSIFEAEAQQLSLNPDTAEFKVQPHEIAAFKVDVSRAGDVDFFQNETQSKLSIAMTCRDQAGGYEFYCDPTGDIVFKPPFYNLNVMPNKPVSWIQDFEIIDDSITESEQEVYTHITSSGNAFGGVTDWGINDEITTPRTGVIDWHLLKRYGWRRLDVQVQWAGNPRKLFYHLLDWLDRVNAKRESGNITIPYRPELRIGFPVWIPKHDSFYYVQGISHQYSPGGQATTTLTLIAKRSKFIAPKNIGIIEKSGTRVVPTKQVVGKPPNQKVVKGKDTFTPTYKIEFPSDIGDSSGIATTKGQTDIYGGPAILRNSKTGKLVGFPNAVMVYRTALNGSVVQRIIEKSGSKKGNNPLNQDKETPEGKQFKYNEIQAEVFTQLQIDKRADLLDRIRLHRYESGMTNAGAYDYAHDVNAEFKEFAIIPTTSISWGAGTKNPDLGTEETANGQTAGFSGESADQQIDEFKKRIDAQIQSLQDNELVPAKVELNKAQEARNIVQNNLKTKSTVPPTQATTVSNTLTEDQLADQERLANANAEVERIQSNINRINEEIETLRSRKTLSTKKFKSLNIMLRPVSDEFGFEVIGHQRYGRGAFINRGQLQLDNGQNLDDNKNQGTSAANQLGIQFASHGGIITDNPIEGSLGTASPNFAELYEKMMPDDYVTGASFKGANYNNENQVSDVNFTSQQTYTDSINNTVTRANKAVFIEADALKRAKTMEELSPTMASGLDAVGFTNCNCGLGRAEWLSVLPETVIRRILGPLTVGQTDPLKFSDLGADRFGSAGKTGTSIPPALQKSLQDASNGEYTPVTVNQMFSPTPDDLAADGGAAAYAAAEGQVVAINNSLQSAASGGSSQIKSADFQSGGLAYIDPDEFNAYSSDAAKRVNNLGMTRTDGNTDSKGIGSDLNLQTLDSGGFFQILSEYLREKFTEEYNINEKREKFAKNAGHEGLVRPDDGIQASNTLDPGSIFGGNKNSLFDRAASGDPDAFAALQEEANFNFGLTEQGVKNFKDTVPNQADQLGKSLASMPGDIFTSSQGLVDPRTGLPSVSIKTQQIQPTPPPAPTLNGVINPRSRSDQYSPPPAPEDL